jgi:hypothetical protein
MPIPMDEEWIAVEYLQHTKCSRQLWDDNLGHLELINFELAKEAEDLRGDARGPLNIEGLEGAADVDTDDDGDDDNETDRHQL